MKKKKHYLHRHKQHENTMAVETFFRTGAVVQSASAWDSYSPQRYLMTGHKEKVNLVSWRPYHSTQGSWVLYQEHFPIIGLERIT